MEILPYVREKCAIQELLQLPYIGSGGLGFGRKVKIVLQQKKFKIFFVDSLISFFHIRGHSKPMLFANSVIESRFTASVYT